jgi:hypothetical protein
MLEHYGELIKDYIKLDNHIVTVRSKIIGYKQEEDMYHGLDVNVAIASAITAGGRMWMSTIKNSSKFNLYYSDTDSAVTDRPLPAFMVGTELGQFKLEHVINKAVFLAPKVYAIVDEDGTETVKVKGLSSSNLLDVHFDDLHELLFVDSKREFNQQKFFKKVIEGEITVQDVAYTLKVTSNKRRPIYVDNIFTNTEPLVINENEENEN